jgi:hypothetical protein
MVWPGVKELTPLEARQRKEFLRLRTEKRNYSRHEGSQVAGSYGQIEQGSLTIAKGILLFISMDKVQGDPVMAFFVASMGRNKQKLLDLTIENVVGGSVWSRHILEISTQQIIAVSSCPQKAQLFEKIKE